MESKNGREIRILVSEPLCGRLNLLREIGRPTVGILTRRSGVNVFLRSWALLYPLSPPPERLAWPRMMKSQFSDCRGSEHTKIPKVPKRRLSGGVDPHDHRAYSSLHDVSTTYGRFGV